MLSNIFSFIKRLIGLSARRSNYNKYLPPGKLDMIDKVALSYEELRVLQAFGTLDEVAIPQLALEARLTPSEMSEVVSRLSSKNLIKTTGHDYFALLTSFGSTARGNFILNADGMNSSMFKPISHNSQPVATPSTALKAENNG